MDEIKYLRNIDQIKEATFKISSNRKLFNDLYGKACYSPYFKYAYVAYTKDKKFLWGHQASEKKELATNFKKELADFVKLYNPASFKDFLFFMDIIPRYSDDLSMSELAKYKYRKYEIVDFILSESRGFLLWHYQFQQLLSFCWDKGWEHIMNIVKIDPKTVHISDEPYNQLVSGLFNRRRFYWDMMKWLKFSNHYTMYDVLKERAIKRRIGNPNIERAYMLYKIMTEG